MYLFRCHWLALVVLARGTNLALVTRILGDGVCLSGRPLRPHIWEVTEPSHWTRSWFASVSTVKSFLASPNLQRGHYSLERKCCFDIFVTGCNVRVQPVTMTKFRQNDEISVSVVYVMAWERYPLSTVSSSLIQVNAWRQTGDKPLPEPMLREITPWAYY